MHLKYVELHNLKVIPYPSHSIADIIAKSPLYSHLITKSQVTFIQCGTVDLLQAGDQWSRPHRYFDFIRQYSPLLDATALRDLCLQPSSPNLFTKHISHHLESLVVDSIIHLIRHINSINPKSIIIFISILPIPKYFNLLDQTRVNINSRILNILSQKPNRIYIPAARAFLDPQNFNLPHLHLYAHREPHHEKVHLSSQGIKILESKIRHYLTPSNVKSKLQSQIKKKK